MRVYYKCIYLCNDRYRVHNLLSYGLTLYTHVRLTRGSSPRKSASLLQNKGGGSPACLCMYIGLRVDLVLTLKG